MKRRDRQRVALVAERLADPYCGIGQFCLQLGRELPSALPATVELLPLVPGPRRDLFSPEIATHGLSRLLRWLPEGGPAADLWHLSHQDTRYRAPVGMRSLLTIHDLNFLEEKAPARARRRLRRLQGKIDRAAAVAVPSRFTEREIRRHLDLSSVDVEVIPNGIATRRVEPERPPFAPAGPFFFAVGQVVPRKNFAALVDLLARFERHALVIAGKAEGPYGEEIRRRARELGVERRVILPGTIDSSHRDWLYENAEAFLFPSLREGFGIPVIEAMSFGTPVLAAARGSLPEVGGQEADYWYELEAPAMVTAYEKARERWRADPSLPQRRKARAARFTWAEAAERYSALYRRCLALPSPVVWKTQGATSD